jgi:hypothetical protein
VITPFWALAKMRAAAEANGMGKEEFQELLAALQASATKEKK